MKHLEEIRDSRTVRGKQTFSAFGNTITTPVDQDKLWQLRVRVHNASQRILDLAIRELLGEIVQRAFSARGYVQII